MARLILINGPASIGKSTLARRYVEDHPLALALDIDVVRGMLGRWLDEPSQAGLIARELALAMARVQLAAGRDVVVPQFLGRLEFVEQLDRLCADVGAEFIEVVLLTERQDAADRFLRRAASPTTAEHRDAEALLSRRGGMPALDAYYDGLLAVVASRPRTRTVRSVEGEIEATYRDLRAQIDHR